MAAFSGVDGTVKSGSTDMQVTGWTGDPEINKIETTTTADGGWQSLIGGIKSFKGSFEFFYQVTLKPTGATANLTPGNKPTLTLQATTGETFSGVGMITKLSLKSKVKDGFMVTASFESDGAWTYPS